MSSSAIPGLSPDLSKILSQSCAEFGDIFSQPDLASIWMLNNPAAMLPGNPFPGEFPPIPSNFGGMNGTKQQKGEEFSGLDPLQFGGPNQVNWLQVLNMMNMNKKQENILPFPIMPMFDNTTFSRNNQLNHHQLVSTQQRSTSAMTSSPELSSTTSVVESQQPPVVTSSNGKRVVTPNNNNLMESSVTKMRLQNRLSGATSHHHMASEGCRWTVNLPKGHMSSSEVEVKKDREGEEFLEVTCGDNNALLYIARLSQGSKGKSILYELGGKQNWMHPNEFQAISGRETAKDWKRSIRHHGKSLKALMSKSVIIHHQNECECEWCLKNIAFFAQQHVTSSAEGEVPNKISHIFPSTINNQREVDDDVNAWQPFVTLPSNLQKSNSSLMGFPADNSPLLAKISESATRNSAFTCVMPSRKKASPSAQSACSTEKKAQSVAASEDRASRKRSNNDEESQNQLNEEATELHPTVNKKSKIENEFLPNLHDNSINFDYKILMQDQSNLVKNMAAAFGQLAPNLLENIKIKCKSQVELSQPEARDTGEFNEKTNSKDAVNRAGLVKNKTNEKNDSVVIKSIQKNVKRSKSVPTEFKEETKKPRTSQSLLNLNRFLEDASFKNSNLLTDKTVLKTDPESRASLKNPSLVGETNNRSSFMSADKATVETILKNSDEMSKWSCEKVGQYLDEINLGQYKQIFLDNGINGHSLPFIREDLCLSRLQMKLGHAHTLISSVHRRLGSYFFILEAHHSPSSPINDSG